MTTTRPFHHGDLKAALVSAAMVALERDGIEKLSLRALAQEIGVARSAPYRHFETRQDLLDEIAAESRRACYAAYAAIPGDLPPMERLKRACRFYLDYVRRHPNLVELTFAGHSMPQGASTRDSPLALFAEMVRDAMPGRDDAEVNLTAMACWSALHGFSMLALSRRTERLVLPADTEEMLIDKILLMVRPVA